MASKLLLLAAVGGARAFSSLPKDKEAPTRVTYSSNIDPSCTDTPGWDNGYGFGCEGSLSYASGWCAGGAVVAGQEWALGPTYNYPEMNCCACGKPPPAPTGPAGTCWLYMITCRAREHRPTGDGTAA